MTSYKSTILTQRSGAGADAINAALRDMTIDEAESNLLKFGQLQHSGSKQTVLLKHYSTHPDYVMAIMESRNCEEETYKGYNIKLNDLLYEEYARLSKIVRWVGNLHLEIKQEFRQKIKAVAFYQLNLLRKVEDTTDWA